MTATLVITLGVMLAIMTLLWLVGLAQKDVSVVDPFWGTGFAIIAWLCVVLNQPISERTLWLAVLTTIWGVRLSAFLLWRNWGHGEDHRYRAMRENHGRRFWWASLFTVFLLQGLILWFVALPIQVVAASRLPTGFNGIDAGGLAIWSVGLLFETVGDWQLARFKAQSANAGKVMDRGLWKYTRHPNYFGDFCVWWGLYIIAIQGGAWWTIASPLVMSVLLIRVSGVTLLETTITARRPDYANYQSRTSAFFPWWPK